MTKTSGFVSEYLDKHSIVAESIDSKAIEKIIKLLEKAITKGKIIYLAGNGGSAALASHAACDLSKNTRVSKGKSKKRPKVLSLTGNVALITAIANDMSYANIFSEQLKYFGKPNDIFVAISGSGNSENIVKAIKTAKKLKMRTVGILGFGGGKAGRLVDVALVVDSKNYELVEDIHLTIFHIIISYFKRYQKEVGLFPIYLRTYFTNVNCFNIG